jgi:hypothetical protein
MNDWRHPRHPTSKGTHQDFFNISAGICTLMGAQIKTILYA